MPEKLFQSVGPKKTSKTARLRELLPLIEAAFAQGHAHASIHERLCAEFDLAITFRYYTMMVHRLRSEREREKRLSPQMPDASRPRYTATGPVPAPAAATAGGSDTPLAVQETEFKFDPKGPVRW